MARLQLCDGRNWLYQWDTGVEIEICECQTVTECHFVTPSGLVKGEVESNVCKIPDAVLTHSGCLIVYAFARDGVYGTTRHEFRINVIARPKPADYIDSTDESTTIDAICDRLKVLPECKGDQGEPGEDGKDGTDATVTAESIQATLGYTPADESDLPGKYELIETITLAEDAVIERTQEPDGTPYSFKAMMIKAKTTGTQAAACRMYYYVGGTYIGSLYYGALSDAQTRYKVDIIEPVYGYWRLITTSWGTNSSVYYNAELGGAQLTLAYPLAEYPSINMIKTNGALGAGTTLEIWGVRTDA